MKYRNYIEIHSIYSYNEIRLNIMIIDYLLLSLCDFIERL